MAGFFVCFRSGTCDLDAAEHALSRGKLTLVRRRGELVVRGPGSQEFRILLSREAEVKAESAEIGEGTSHAAEMRECDARFEVSFDSLDDALDEYTTLHFVEEALQEVSRGFLYLMWNGNLLAPNDGGRG